jgi:hypothetical protein
MPRRPRQPRPTGVFLSVPARFDAARHPALKGLADEAHYVLHRIVNLSVTYRHGAGDFVPVGHQTLRTFMQPKAVAVVLAALRRAGAVERDGRFLPRRLDPAGKGKSFGYRLTPAMWAGGLRRLEVGKASLAAKVRRHRVTRDGRPVAEAELDPVHRYLLAWLRRTRIDVERAYRIVNASPVPLGRRGRTKVAVGYAATVEAQRRAAALRCTCDAIAGGEPDVSVCPYGRFHSPVTRLLTEARPCLSVDGQPLVSLDVRNSQVVFFALLLLGDARTYEADEMYTSKGVMPPGHEPVRPRDGGGLGAGWAGLVPADVVRFASLTLAGTIYDHLMAAVHEADRKAFKQRFFAEVLYGDPSRHYVRASPLTAVFRKQFPTVWAFVLRQKRDGYERLAREMQRRESAFMLHRVCRRLMEHHPAVPVLTIHDSVLTTRPHVGLVRRVMREEFERLGVPAPAFKEEPAEPSLQDVAYRDECGTRLRSKSKSSLLAIVKPS